LRAHQLFGAQRLAVGAAIGEVRCGLLDERVARIDQAQLAAERRIGAASAIIDIIDPRLIGPGVRVRGIGGAQFGNVRPHLGLPLEARRGGTAKVARVPQRHFTERAGYAARRCAAPVEQVGFRMPAVDVRMREARMRLGLSAIVRPSDYRFVNKL